MRNPADYNTARIILVGDDGVRRASTRISRRIVTSGQGQGSVYIHPVVESPAYLEWQPLVARGGLGADLHFSVHASRVMQLRHQANSNLIRYEAVPIDQYDAPHYVLTILTPELEYYPPVLDDRPEDVDIDVSGMPPGFALHIAVGPDLSAKVPADKVRVPYPGVTDQSEVRQIVTGVRPPLYFGIAVATVRGSPPPPPAVECWAPIQMPTTADYLPRPAVPYRPERLI